MPDDNKIDEILGPESHYAGPMSGLGASHDSWKTAVDKINANFKKIAKAFGVPLAASTESDDIAKLGERVAALEKGMTDMADAVGTMAATINAMGAVAIDDVLPDAPAQQGTMTGVSATAETGAAPQASQAPPPDAPPPPPPNPPGAAAVNEEPQVEVHGSNA